MPTLVCVEHNDASRLRGQVLMLAHAAGIVRSTVGSVGSVEPAHRELAFLKALPTLTLMFMTSLR